MDHRKKKCRRDETVEFIETLKRSEYSVVEQLKRLSAQISIPSLLLSSETHLDALLKILNESYVSKKSQKISKT